MSAIQRSNRNEIWVFLFITLLLSYIFWYFINESGNYYLYMTGLMWSPGIAGIFTRLFFKESLSEIGFKWINTKWILRSYLFPIFYLGVAYCFIWLIGLGSINHDEINAISAKLGISSTLISTAAYVVFLGLFGPSSYLFAAAGEELGWRGFLLKKLLTNTGTLKASLIVGIIWAIWHYPLFHINGLTIEASNWIPIMNFTLMVIALSFIYTKFYMYSNNIWTSILLHTSHNLFLQRFFSPLTNENDQTYLYADETGFIIMGVLVIINVVIILNKTK